MSAAAMLQCNLATIASACVRARVVRVVHLGVDKNNTQQIQGAWQTNSAFQEPADRGESLEISVDLSPPQNRDGLLYVISKMLSAKSKLAFAYREGYKPAKPCISFLSL